MQKVPGSGRRKGTKDVATLEKELLQAESRIQQMEERNIASQGDEMPFYPEPARPIGYLVSGGPMAVILQAIKHNWTGGGLSPFGHSSTSGE
jgi:hypothetical protein